MMAILKVRTARVFFSFSLLATLSGLASAAPPRIIVTFRGTKLTYGRSIAPFRSQATVLVPVRETGKLIGAKVSLQPDGKHITINYSGDTLTYQPGHHGYRINGRHQSMRGASEYRNGHLFVPIRLFNDITAGRIHAEIQ